MLENSLEKFSLEVFLFLSGVPKYSNSLLVKKHTENLQINGDFSFPNTSKSWHFVAVSDQNAQDCDKSLMNCIGKCVEDMIEESKNWKLPIYKTKEDKGRIHVFLDRRIAIRVGLYESLRNDDVIKQKMLLETSEIHIDPMCDEKDSLTFLRLKCLSDTIKNLHVLRKSYKEQRCSNIIVSSKSFCKSQDSKMVLCGVVLNAETGAKETNLNADDFIRLRQDEMTLIAQHKYGVRVSTDAKWKDFIAHLGESAVIFELLQTRPSCAVKINFDHSSGSSKGASFILYNCARLETIIRTYNEKVEQGTYPSLPSIEDTDLTLLTQEDEWNLIFNYIMGFPTLLTNCVDICKKNCEFRPHQICSFLSAMVRVFSQYYRRTRILTEPRKHMLPVMFARMHMLKILNETLKTCLRILNIKSVSQM